MKGLISGCLEGVYILYRGPLDKYKEFKLKQKYLAINK